MSRQDHHARIVAQLGNAAIGDISWTTALADVAEPFGIGAAVLAVTDADDVMLASAAHGQSSELARQYYASEVFTNDPRARHHFSVQPGRIYYDHCLYDVASMLRDPRVRDSIDMIGVAHQLGAVMRLPDGGRGYFTLLSTEAEGHASEETVTAFHRLAPFIEQACAIGQVVQARAATQAILLEALAARTDGVILLACSGALTFQNDVARRMLARADGLVLAGDRLAASRGPETRRLQTMIRQAISVSAGAQDAVPGGEMLVSRPAGLRPYVVRVMPAPPVECFLAGRSIACVLHINDLATTHSPRISTLRAVFGLSEREADLAVSLLRTVGLAAAATDARMALNTARNHLQGIFRKCAVATQAEAVQLLGRL